MNIIWNTCDGGVWCPLINFNLNHHHFNQISGVYIIWHAGQFPATVRVGQGHIRERLTEHRQNPDILAFASLGLYVTWAELSSVYQNGIEAFLANQLQPKIGSRYPIEVPIPANLPW